MACPGCNFKPKGAKDKNTNYIGVDYSKNDGGWDPYTACLSGKTCDVVPMKGPGPKPKVGAGCLKNLDIQSLIKKGWKKWSMTDYKFHTTKKEIQPTSGDCVLWGSQRNAGDTRLTLAGIGRRKVIQNNKLVKENGLWWYTVYG